ncbi:similar to Saccharomyces cerevisiae YBR079C RPG1 eIF3a subunit of the core complex of translation initiation factor 3 (eIF3), essential for translation [Maudiozyma saulgeensis]|uniref:Eukaryotic translation initiation factor 3 subunit A n=1 Tax=Maudiozyma saulgeensis TaxID=1789683 RepID=A0A1X7R846_9SACH|nr:similar to Saccharomyces cerevisiae YBR079C RPG1 eIF3a subunit of the core complex of translation initiation factor 3 (eIF3), essential for translation [Kazachstania saulgeensis]
MAPPPLRPENALKRAEELISVGESQAALQSLFDFFTARRIRFAEPAAIEPIVFRFLELGVDLKKGRMIKDALHQYKKLVQGSPEGLASVSTISRKFIDIVEKKIASEQAKEDQKADEEDDDLEGGVTPENLLISAYEEDQSVAGFNDEALTSWMRFTWESYRAVLDLLRNNSQLEITYSGVVNRTMMFCLKNNRKNEFKRLADMLRQHLDAANYQQSKSGTNIVDLSDNDTLQRYLEQRFQLVNCSVKLELWHEAFRSIEDVFHLMKLSKSSPKASTLANYYQNMAKVFLVSGDSLLHTVAWKKFYDLYISNPNATDDDFKTYTSTIFLSVLASKLDDLPTVGYDRQFRLYRLLGLEGKPARKDVMATLLEDDFFKYVNDDIKSLYNAMEVEFSADGIKSQLSALLPKLNALPYFAQYVESIRDIIVRRSIVEASTNNDSITLANLYKLVTLPEPFNMSEWDIERALLEAAVEDYVSFTIDHESNTVQFVKDPFTVFTQVSAEAEATEGAEEEEEEEIPEEIEGEEEEIVEVETTEAEEAEGEEGATAAEPEVIVTRNFYIRNRLSELSKTLSEVETFAGLPYVAKVKLAREALIERNKESIEKAKAAAEERTKRHQEARRKYQEENALHAEADAEVRQKRNLEEKALMEAKLAEDARQRLIEKKRRELTALKETITAKAIADINSKGNVYIDPALAKTMELKDLRTMIVSLLSKDQMELQEKVEYARNRLDYTERALRKVEYPILQKEAEDHKAVDMKKYEEMNEKIIAAAKAEHEARLEDHERLTNVYSDFQSLKTKLESAHEAEFGAQRDSLKAKFEEAKKARIAEVRQQRYDELIAKRKSEIAAEERAARAKADEEVMRKRREMEDAVAAKHAAAAAPAAAAATIATTTSAPSQPKASPFGSMNDAKRDEIARRQREMEAALEERKSQPKASPFGSMNDTKRDEIARKQREMEAALEQKNSSPAPKKGAYVPPSRRNRK